MYDQEKGEDESKNQLPYIAIAVPPGDTYNNIELTKIIIKYSKIFYRAQLGDLDKGYRVYYKYL